MSEAEKRPNTPRFRHFINPLPWQRSKFTYAPPVDQYFAKIISILKE